jgi:hypothetical protein
MRHFKAWRCGRTCRGRARRSRDHWTRPRLASSPPGEFDRACCFDIVRVARLAPFGGTTYALSAMSCPKDKVFDGSICDLRWRSELRAGTVLAVFTASTPVSALAGRDPCQRGRGSGGLRRNRRAARRARPRPIGSGVAVGEVPDDVGAAADLAVATLAGIAWLALPTDLARERGEGVSRLGHLEKSVQHTVELGAQARGFGVVVGRVRQHPTTASSISDRGYQFHPRTWSCTVSTTRRPGWRRSPRPRRDAHRMS